MKIFYLCQKYLIQYRYQLIIYIAITLISTAITILSPYILGDFLDTLITGADITSVLRFCAVFGGLNILRILMGYATSIIYVKVQTKMGYDLNMSVIKHVQSLSLSYFNKQDSAYLNQRINNDANNLIIFCITILQSIITNVIMFIVPFVVLLAMNWFVAVLMIAFLALYMTLYIVFKKPLYKASFAFKEAQSKFFSCLYDQLKYIKLIKINSIQQETNKKAYEGFAGLIKATVNNQKINYLFSGLDGFITTLAQIALFVIGGIQILDGNFTIGMFTIFSSYFNMMIGSSRYFFNLGASYHKVLVSYDRIVEIFGYKAETNGEQTLVDIQKIELNNIAFSYDVNPSKPKPLNNLTSTFKKGKIYAITGENGTGKSTLINLIMGMYINEFSGNISYNGINIKDIDMQRARKTLFGFAEQEPMLINDTIWYNLTFEDSNKFESIKESPANPKYKALRSHLQTLNMMDFVSEYTLNLKINDKNTNTSGGEKQKISILKVLLKDPVVMIFDEPTSALDWETSAKFMRHLQQIKESKIIIIITHDNAVEQFCDETISLNGMT